MLQSKNMYVANFNLTFGENDEPMLNYFDSIVYPALKKYEGNKEHRNFYVFENITLTMKNGVFVIGGLIVKRTNLEVRSHYDEQGVLRRTDDVIPAAPYSYFMINLKNHRIVLVKNQRGSPTLKNFERTTRHFMNEYIKSQLDKKLPKPYLNILSIPHSGKIKDELKRVKKIEQLILRFYPLNGDISTNETFNHLRGMLEATKSKSGNTQINTPRDHDQVGEILDETKGLVKPVLKVVYDNNARRTLRNNDFSETISIELNEDETFEENLQTISENLIDQDDYIETSEENANIYDKKLSLIEKIIKKE